MIQYNIFEGLKRLGIDNNGPYQIHITQVVQLCFVCVSPLLNKLHRADATVKQHVLPFGLRVEGERCDQDEI